MNILVLSDGVDEGNDCLLHVTAFRPSLASFREDLGDIEDIDLNTGTVLTVQLVDLFIQCLVSLGRHVLRFRPVVNGSPAASRYNRECALET